MRHTNCMLCEINASTIDSPYNLLLCTSSNQDFGRRNSEVSMKLAGVSFVLHTSASNTNSGIEPREFAFLPFVGRNGESGDTSYSDRVGLYLSRCHTSLPDINLTNFGVEFTPKVRRRRAPKHGVR